jgi:hypothetical protein
MSTLTDISHLITLEKEKVNSNPSIPVAREKIGGSGGFAFLYDSF